MWFGYVPQIKNTDVIFARGLHFSRSLPPSPPPPVFFHTPDVANVSSLPTNLSAVFSAILADVSAFRAFAESNVSTLEFHLHMYTRVLAYKLLFLETKGGRERERMQR